MKDFTIALVQHGSPIGAKADNLDATRRWTRKAKKAGAQLVCFPELGLTGHGGHADMVAEWEPVPDGPAVGALCDLAAELNIYISAGIAERQRGVPYNTQFVVGPKGYVGKQRKVHLSGDEAFHFRPGTAMPVIELPFVKLGIIICYDNQFPEMARCMALKGAELLFAPHAARSGKWRRDPKARRELVARGKAGWFLVHRCRAVDNGCYVAFCNTAGQSARHLKGVDANHAGGCFVIDPGGKVIAQSRSRDVRDEMIVVKLKGKAVERKPNTFRNRRPEVFRILSEPTV